MGKKVDRQGKIVTEREGDKKREGEGKGKSVFNV